IACRARGGPPAWNARYAKYPAAAAIRRKIAASTKNPGHALPLKTSSSSSQAMPSTIRTSANAANTPAAAPTAEPRMILPTFSLTSALASSISSRTRTEVFSETSKISSPTDWSSVGFGGVTPGPAIEALLGRLLVKHAPPEDGGQPGRRDARQGAARRQHPAPNETFDHVVLHTRQGPTLPIGARGRRRSWR